MFSKKKMFRYCSALLVLKADGLTENQYGGKACTHSQLTHAWNSIIPFIPCQMHLRKCEDCNPTPT